MMFVEAILAQACEKLVMISDDELLLNAAKLLTAGTDIFIVCAANGSLVGVITKTDIVRQISTCQGSLCQSPVTFMMTRDVLTCRGNDTLQNVLAQMKARHLKNVPVVDVDHRPLAY